jgi:hypothetical protein
MQIHEALLDENPSLSLGTTCRNLEVLVDADPCARGPARYDANLDLQQTQQKG